MSAVNPALLQNLDTRPKKVVLLPPQMFVFVLSAGDVPTRMANWEAEARDNIRATAVRLATGRRPRRARPQRCRPYLRRVLHHAHGQFGARGQ